MWLFKPPRSVFMARQLLTLSSLTLEADYTDQKRGMQQYLVSKIGITSTCGGFATDCESWG